MKKGIELTREVEEIRRLLDECSAEGRLSKLASPVDCDFCSVRKLCSKIWECVNEKDITYFAAKKIVELIIDLKHQLKK